MTSLSVDEYMKRLDQLASKSISAPELIANKRQPLQSLSSNQRTVERTSAKVRTERTIRVSTSRGLSRLASLRTPVQSTPSGGARAVPTRYRVTFSLQNTIDSARQISGATVPQRLASVT